MPAVSHRFPAPCLSQVLPGHGSRSDLAKTFVRYFDELSAVAHRTRTTSLVLRKGLYGPGGLAGAPFELSDPFSYLSPPRAWAAAPLAFLLVPPRAKPLPLMMSALPLTSAWIAFSLFPPQIVFSLLFSIKCVSIDFRGEERETLIGWVSKPANRTRGPIGNQAGGLLVQGMMLNQLATLARPSWFALLSPSGP